MICVLLNKGVHLSLLCLIINPEKQSIIISAQFFAHLRVTHENNLLQKSRFFVPNLKIISQPHYGSINMIQKCYANVFCYMKVYL